MRMASESLNCLWHPGFRHQDNLDHQQIVGVVDCSVSGQQHLMPGARVDERDEDCDEVFQTVLFEGCHLELVLGIINRFRHPTCFVNDTS